MKKHMNIKLKKGGYAAALSLIAAAALILFNMIIGKLPENLTRLDLSGTKIYSVGDTTKETLSGLTSDVTIYVVADPESVDTRITNFLGQYEALSPHIQVETLDSILHPDQVQAMEAENNSLLVSCEATGKKETIPFSDIIQKTYTMYGYPQESAFDGEGQVTSAVSRVVSDTQKIAYQTEGHRENPLPSSVTEMLEKSNFTVADVNLLTAAAVPEDCDLLIVNAPQTDLAQDEADMILSFLDGGGHVMLLSGPLTEERPNLEKVMNAYGISQLPGYTADLERFYQNNPFYMFPVYADGHELVSSLESDSLALVAQSGALKIMDSVPEGVTAEPFLTTSENAVRIVSDTEQEPGSFVLAAAAEKETGDETASLVVFASPSIIDEGITSVFSNLSNLDIFMNAAAWNFGDVENISIPSKSLEITYNTVKNSGSLSLIFVLIIPAATAAGGFIIWMRRRRL